MPSMPLSQGIHQAWRKSYVMRKNMTARKAWNSALRVLAFVTARPGIGGVPLHIKVDISPNCQLRCPICLHSTLTHAERTALPPAMNLDTFKQLVDQVAGRTLVMSLYNLGEPLLNNALIPMIRHAAQAKVNTYITTNFSMRLTDAYLSDLAHSGLTLLIVAVDGITPATFGQQRIKGKLAVIEDNLRRLHALKHRDSPRVTLQYLVFDHNRHEVPEVESYCRRMGVDHALIVNGTDGTQKPWLQQFAPRRGWLPRKARRLPLCGWPYLSALVSPEGKVYGCCHYRMDENYLRVAESRPMGDIFTASFDEIYASEAFRTARKLVHDPARHGPQPDHFCHGCPVLQEDAP